MISDYQELLHGTYGEFRRNLIHAMLVYDPMNADPYNGKVPYLRSKKKRKELILQAIEEVSGDAEDWLEDAYLNEFGQPYIREYDEEEWEDE